MISFIDEITADLYSRYGANMDNVKILLPSRRARVFLTDALSKLLDKPIWQPTWCDIDSLMIHITGVTVGDKLRLIAELFNVYHKYHPSEQFDKFYFWGEVLLSDFDMIDKYRIDADMLFRNVADIKELETDTSYLTPKQLQIISFWNSVTSDNPEELSKMKIKFLEIWRSLKDIYHDYRKQLTTINIAYSGMIHRMAADRLRSDNYDTTEFDNFQFVVAGFNALNSCEKILFDKLKDRYNAHFYWDWDSYYCNNRSQEAGLFIKDNIVRYPSTYKQLSNNFESEKEINVAACTSSSLQCKYVSNILKKLEAEGTKLNERTAIILTDETLLIPLLYALPPNNGARAGVNVTMGYPLRHSLAYSFVERLIELQNHISRGKEGDNTLYYRDVIGLLSHPYIDALIPKERCDKSIQHIRSERLIRVSLSALKEDIDPQIVDSLFRITSNWQGLSRYICDVIEQILTHNNSDEESLDVAPKRQSLSLQDEVEQRIEFLSFIATEMTKLHNSVEKCGIELNTSIYLSLLRRHLQPLKVPFEGEPLEGLQVMGILESRTLDFDNIILLSMNDDNFPGNKTITPSYVPYNLRSAYEIPTAEHHDGVYAYYFYRLIQRAQRVWMLYSSVASDKSTGEQSRYISQLDYESPHSLNRIDVGVDVNLFEPQEIEIAKCGKVREQLMEYIIPHKVIDRESGKERFERRNLAPTTLCKYADCPLKFYYKALAAISNRDEEITDDIDAPMFGNILHLAMQTLYEKLADGTIVQQRLKHITTNDITNAIDKAIRECYFSNKDVGVSDYSGDIIIAREVVINYIKDGILRYDINSEPFEIVGLESRRKHEIEVVIDGLADTKVSIGGICDRIDKIASGEYRIVDYKSGGKHLSFEGIESLFTGSSTTTEYIFQTMLYSLILHETGEARGEIIPSLYFAREMNKPDFKPLLYDEQTKQEVTDYIPYHEEFAQSLREMLNELFNIEIPFRQAQDISVCKYCDYAALCRRE